MNEQPTISRDLVDDLAAELAPPQEYTAECVGRELAEQEAEQPQLSLFMRLNDDEDRATAECGCVLDRYDSTGSISFWTCPSHTLDVE